MEELHWWPAVIGGLLGGIVMSMMMAMARKAGKTKMDIELMEGAFFTGDPKSAKAIGFFMHLVIMSALLFGTIYALLFAALDVAVADAWWYGALFGLVHGLVAGTAMVMMPLMHPRMGPEPVVATAGVHLESPGLFAKNYGAMTPAGELASHILYGLILGLVYGWLAG